MNQVSLFVAITAGVIAAIACGLIGYLIGFSRGGK